MKLHLWVEAKGSSDMDLTVSVEKLDPQGRSIPSPMTGAPIRAMGY